VVLGEMDSCSFSHSVASFNVLQIFESKSWKHRKDLPYVAQLRTSGFLKTKFKALVVLATQSV